MLTIIPAVDLKGGRCVRLKQGRADDAKVYSTDPVETAKKWENEGARYLHVVDLDGAFDGVSRHVQVIERIVAALTIPVEMGGGLRTDDDIERAIACGVARAIIGTRAFTAPGELASLAERYGDRLAVGIDARNGRVQIKGWVETTTQPAAELAAAASDAGVRTIIYTDTATDGMLEGVNAVAIGTICDAASCDVVAAGGITTGRDIESLAGLARRNLVGAIVGKALYEGTTSLPELQRVADQAHRE